MISEDDLLPFLRRDDLHVQLTALRALKNSVIGHSEQKSSYLDRGVVPDLLAIVGLSSDGVHDPLYDECRIEAGVVLGSFANSDPEISSRLITEQTFTTLVQILNVSTPPQLLLACLRTLTALLTAEASTSFVHQYPAIPTALATLMLHYSVSLESHGLTQQNTQILTRLCDLVPLVAPSHSFIHAFGLKLTPPLVKVVRCTILRSPRQPPVNRRLQSTAILALSHVLTPVGARELSLSAPEFTDALLALLRAPETATRLSSASLLTTLYTSGLSDSGSSSGVTRAPQNEALALVLVPTLMKLLDDSLAAGDDGRGCDPQILQTLAIVCREGGEVADRCVEVGLIKKIVSVVMLVAPNNHFSTGRMPERETRLLAGGLLCLAALGLHKEEYRKSIIEAGALGVVVAVMNRASTPAMREVKIAACHVLRTLSRSVLLLRTTIVESGVVGGVVDLLGDPVETPMDTTVDTAEPELLIADYADEKAFDIEDKTENLEVRAAAMAAVCNLVLEFSPLRKPILDKGILPLIVAGARSRYAPLRLNSVWALKHMVYGDDMETKAHVVSQLSFPLLMRLCDDEEIQVQEQALDFIRNLIARSENYIDMFLENVGVAQVFELLSRKLGLDEDPNNTEPYYTEVVVCTAYVLVHIAAGYERHREVVIQQEEILKKVIRLMSHERDEVRLACVWFVINLTWAEEAGRGPGPEDEDEAMSASGEIHFTECCRRRAEVLVGLGLREMLEVLKQDRVLDVREKTKTAVYQIENLLGDGNEDEAGLGMNIDVDGIN
ncbi:armadillo-type protein [Lipomyces arxii]|uniref:armadillo-type protein n=1 Tax=Lipomyces arxii TaxID=56418 RepID=UPI0034CE5BB5